MSNQARTEFVNDVRQVLSSGDMAWDDFKALIIRAKEILGVDSICRALDDVRPTDVEQWVQGTKFPGSENGKRVMGELAVLAIPSKAD